MIHHSPLDNVRVVLSHTSHPGNIGASARAMKTMGLSSLYLVNPKSFPDNEAYVRATNARDILDQAVICSTLDIALQDCVLAVAMTARTRELTHQVIDTRQVAQKLVEIATESPVALVFGRESSGLTTAEVTKCQLTVHIPTSSTYASLNLAAAVQIMCYELRMAAIDPENQSPRHEAQQLASLNEIELFYQHLEEALITSKFLDPQQPKRLMQRIRRLFSRTTLEKEEVNILRGIIHALAKEKR